MVRRLPRALAAASILATIAINPTSHDTASAPPAQVREADGAPRRYGQLTRVFEPNVGQTDPRARFLSRGQAYSLFLGDDEVTLRLRSRTPGKPDATLGMRLVGARQASSIVGESVQPGTVNYYAGNDPSKWHGGVPTYGKVRYKDVYVGVDLLYYGADQQIEYDFIVSPGTTPDIVRLQFDGADDLRIDDGGDLIIDVAGHPLRQARPEVYQIVDGSRRTVPAEYVIADGGQVGFAVGDYNRRLPLAIDPVIYTTYLGGTGTERARAIAVDSLGQVVIAGLTTSSDFPTANAMDETPNFGDVFVAKLNPAGTGLVYSTYLGPTYSNADYPVHVALDSFGNAYVAGVALPGFPTTAGAFDRTLPALEYDGFVTKLSATGALEYSTLLGGDGIDGVAIPRGFDVDAAGSAFLVGEVDGGLAVVKMNPTGSARSYFTFLDPAGLPSAHIAVDPAGHALILGVSHDGICGFNTSTGFLAELDPTGHRIRSMCLSSSVSMQSRLAVDDNYLYYTVQMPANSTNVYLETYRRDFSAGGSSELIGTGRGGAIDVLDGRVYISGVYGAPTRGAIKETGGVDGDGIGADGFLSVIEISEPIGNFAPEFRWRHATYFGGSGIDSVDAIAVAPDGAVYVAGITNSTDLATPGAFQPAYAGGFDANGVAAVDVFIAKLTLPDAIAPVANAGPDRTVSCATVCPVPVTLDSAGSSSPAPSGTLYRWKTNGGIQAFGPTPTITLAPGVHTLTLTVTDQLTQLAATDTVIITVESALASLTRQVTELQTALDAAHDTIAARDATIAAKNAALASKDVDIDAKSAAIAARDQTIRDHEATLAGLRDELASAIASIGGRDETIARLESDIQTANQTIAARDARIGTLETELGTANQTIATRDGTIAGLESDLRTANQTIADRNGRVATLETDLQAANQTIAARDASIAGLQRDLTGANATIATLTGENGSLRAANTALAGESTRLTAANTALVSELTAANQTIGSLTQQLAAANMTNAALHAQVANLQAMLRNALGDPAFTIPGATPSEQVQNLTAAINGLNPGQKLALYKNLGGKKK